MHNIDQITFGEVGHLSTLNPLQYEANMWAVNKSLRDTSVHSVYCPLRFILIMFLA